MKSLYEISDSYSCIIRDIMESSEVTDEQMEALKEVNGDFKEKAISVGSFIKNLETENEAIEKAINSMEERRERTRKKCEKMREYLKDSMGMCEMTEIRSPYFDMKIKVNPAAVIIKDAEIIPKQYVREMVTKKIDKTLISRDLKNNVFVPGACLEIGVRLEIK